MRGRIAAAFAAVMVGLSPAMPLASFAAAVACASAESSLPVAAASIDVELSAGTVSRSERTFSRPAAQRTIWRAPSAPAPSQAPPAARA